VHRTSYMFITGPDVIRTVTREEVTKSDLGGADTHSRISGVAHMACGDEQTCLASIRKLMSFLPASTMQDPPFMDTSDSPEREDPHLNQLIPTDPNKPYDIKELIRSVVDQHDFFEIHENFARNIVVGFARLAGNTVGIVANQPAVLAGTLDID